MARNRVKLTIAGADYMLVSDEPIAYVAKIGREVDTAMTELINAGHMTPLKAAVLTAITEHDKAQKAEQSADHLRDQIREYLEENARLRAEVERLRRG